MSSYSSALSRLCSCVLCIRLDWSILEWICAEQRRSILCPSSPFFLPKSNAGDLFVLLYNSPPSSQGGADSLSRACLSVVHSPPFFSLPSRCALFVLFLFLFVDLPVSVIRFVDCPASPLALPRDSSGAVDICHVCGTSCSLPPNPLLPLRPRPALSRRFTAFKPHIYTHIYYFLLLASLCFFGSVMHTHSHTCSFVRCFEKITHHHLGLPIEWRPLPQQQILRTPHTPLPTPPLASSH